MNGRTALGVAAALLVAACGDRPTQISNSGYGAYEVGLAPYGDGLAVAWYDTRDGNAEIYAQLLDPDGRAKGGAYRLTEDPEQSYEVSIASGWRSLAVAWYDKDSHGALRARLGLWSPQGGFVWQLDPTGSERPSRNPVVRVLGSRVFCAWIERDDSGAESVRGGWWSLAGDTLVEPVALGAASTTTWNLNAALDRDTAYVVFDAQIDTAASEVYLTRWNGHEAVTTRLTGDDDHTSKYPDLAISDPDAALTWFDERDGNREVYFLPAPVANLGSGTIGDRARRITRSQGESIGAYLAWSGNRIGLAWSDEVTGVYDVFFQEFSRDGHPSAGIRRLSDTTTRSLIPAIHGSGDGFAVAWNEVSHENRSLHDPATRSEVSFVRVR